MEITEALNKINKLDKEINKLKTGRFTKDQQRISDEIARKVKSKINWDEIFKDF